MIRATRGRSRRPNHMRSPLDALQTPTPVTFRRFPRDFHSVAKQASFETAFVRVPIRFWIDFGRSKWKQKSIFGRFFAMPLPSALLNRFFGDFLKSEPWFFCAQPVFCKDFHQIDVFEKARKKTDLGSILGGQSDKKLRKHSVEKYHSFEHWLFCVFC